MRNSTTSVLLIEDSDEYAGLIAASLERSEGDPVRLVRTRNLAEGLAAIENDSDVDSVARLHERHPGVPILLLTASSDPEMGDRMIEAGAWQPGFPASTKSPAGGLPKGRTTLIAGSGGSGKTVMACQFLAAGIPAGESGVFVTFLRNDSPSAEGRDG